jgi:hypothetical protein
MTLSSEWRKQVVRKHLEKRQAPSTPIRELKSSADCKTPAAGPSDALVRILHKTEWPHLTVDAIERAMKAP